MNNKKNAAEEEYFEKTEKYMNAFWGFSDSDQNDNVNKRNEKKRKKNNGSFKQIHNEKKKSKIISNKVKADSETEKPLNFEKVSFERNALNRRESGELIELSAHGNNKKKKKTHKERNTDVACYNERKGVEEEDMHQKSQKGKRENVNYISKKKNYKKTKDNPIFSKTISGKMENVEDVFDSLSKIQGTTVKEEKKEIWNSTTRKRNKKEPGGKKEEKKQRKNEVKLIKKETNEKQNTLNEERREFKNLLQEVQNVAKQHLDKFQKKIILNQEIKKLGGKFDKSRKMPYPELICRKRALKKYIQERKEMERYAGVKLQSGDYIDMQDVFRKKKKEKKKERWKNFKLF